jgi:hypothetical protein
MICSILESCREAEPMVARLSFTEARDPRRLATFDLDAEDGRV